MIYEYTITCEKCGYRVASGNFMEQINLSQSDVMEKARHNPGCPVPACRDAYKIKVTDTATTYDHAIVSEYAIKYSSQGSL